MSKTAKILLSGAAATTAVAGVWMAELGKYMARATITPKKYRKDEFEIIPCSDENNTSAVVLPATPETLAPGQYSLYFDDGKGFARVGKILEHDDIRNTVMREIEAVPYGDFGNATGASWYGYVWSEPSEMGLKHQDINIETENGPAPSWLLEANPGQVSETCVIQVHGRGATKAEGLRSTPVLLDAGLDVLLINYRNDFNGPPARNGLYGLGYTEWHDVEAAIDYAVHRGAKKILLYGWSMGGATVMQTYQNSRYKSLIEGIVLDAPALDWKHILRHIASRNKLPEVVGTIATYTLSGKMGAFVKRNSAVVNIKAMDWLSKPEDIQVPILLFHSTDDNFVPYQPSEALAEKCPEFITYVKSSGAQHTKEWNVDPDWYEDVLAQWLQSKGFNLNNPEC